MWLTTCNALSLLWDMPIEMHLHTTCMFCVTPIISLWLPYISIVLQILRASSPQAANSFVTLILGYYRLTVNQYKQLLRGKHNNSEDFISLVCCVYPKYIKLLKYTVLDVKYHFSGRGVTMNLCGMQFSLDRLGYCTRKILTTSVAKQYIDFATAGIHDCSKLYIYIIPQGPWSNRYCVSYIRV